MNKKKEKKKAGYLQRKKKKPREFFFALCVFFFSVMILRIPSAILHDACVQLPREYAFKVFWSLQQTDQHTRFFDASFLNPADATTFENAVRKQLNATIECCGIENCILLPPLFLRAQENAIVHLSSQILLVMCREGPVIPVLLLRSQPFLKQSTPQSTQPSLDKQSTPQSTQPSLEKQSSPQPFFENQSTPQSTQPFFEKQSTPQSTPQPAFEKQQSTPQFTPQVLSPTPQKPMVEPALQIVTEPNKECIEDAVSIRVVSQPPPQHKTNIDGSVDASQVKPVLTPEEERRFIEMMTKTPISATFNLHDTATSHEKLSPNEQLQKYQQMRQSIDALQSQRMQLEQILLNPHISPATQDVVQKSLDRKCKYIQQQLTKIAAERARLIEQQQVNEIARRVLLGDADADTIWHKNIADESSHLRTCIDLLEAANPNMSV